MRAKHQPRQKKTGAKLIIICSIITCVVFAVVLYIVLKPKDGSPLQDTGETAQLTAPPPNEQAEVIPDDVPEEQPGEMPDDVPGEMPDDVPGEMPDDVPGEIPDDVPGEIPDDAPGDIPEETPEPIPEPTPIPIQTQQEFDQNWVVVFEALTQRDFEAANIELLALEKIAGERNELLEKHGRLSLLAQSASEFGVLWSRALSQLTRGDQLRFGPGSFITVVAITPVDIAITANQEEKIYSLDRLPRGIERAIVQNADDLMTARSLMAAGAHFATFQDTTTADLDTAREFWSQASELDPTAGNLLAVLLDNPHRPQLVEPDKPYKVLVPTGVEKQENLDLVETMFEKQIESATTRVMKQDLASLIFLLSKQPVGTSDELFAILHKAYTLARDSGDPSLTDQVRTRLDQVFIIDVLSMNLNDCETWGEMITEHDSVAERSPRYHALAVILGQLGDTAEVNSRYEIAVQAYSLGFRLNKRSTIRPRFSAILKTKLEQAEARVERKTEFQDASEQLKQDPDDPDANFKAGRYLALTRDHFPAAFPYLRRGSDESLKNLARLEQAFPVNSSEMELLGNAWRDYAWSSAETLDQALSFRRSADWYRDAYQEEVSTLKKLRIQKELEKLPRPEFDVPANGLVFFYPFNGNVMDESDNDHPSKLDKPQFVPDVMNRENSALMLDGTGFLAISNTYSLHVGNEFSLSTLVSMAEQPPNRRHRQLFGHPIVSDQTALNLGVTDPVNGQFRWQASLNNGRNMQDISQPITSRAFVVPGTWTHVVYSVDRFSCELWINGVRDRSIPRAEETIDKIGSGDGPFALGSSGYGGSQFHWVGRMDSFRFYNRKLNKQEIHSLYQVDTGQGIPRASTENPLVVTDGDITTVTNEVPVKLDQQVSRYLLELPEMVDKESLTLKIEDLNGFPETKIVTPNSTAKAGKDVVINLVNSPSRVKFRVRISSIDDDAYILVRPTFRLLTNSTRDTPLTIEQVKESIAATDLNISKARQERENHLQNLPKIQSEIDRQSRGTAQHNIAVINYTRTQKRIRLLESEIPRHQLLRDRLQTLLGTVTELSGSATIHFRVDSTPAGADE